MSAPLSCCNPCATIETVNIPGLEGDPGINGTDGQNAYTRVTANFTIPAQGDTVDIAVESSVWLVVGQVVIVGEGIIPSDAPNGWANFQVAALPNSTTIRGTFLNYSGDTATGQVLADGCTVSPAGLIGPAGP